MQKRVLLSAALGVLVMLVLLGCSVGGARLSGITSTPTKTLRPVFTSTMTPTATALPTDTPVPPTDTPAPTASPLPTETPVPPTAVPPTDTPIPPTDTPAPPPNTPQPSPTKTAALPTKTPKPQVQFKVKDIVAFVDGSLTSTGLHNIYFTVTDAGGAPLDGVILQDVANSPQAQVITGNKGPGKTEFTMWGADYRFQVVGNVGGQTFSSETTHVLSVLQGHAVWDDLIRGGMCADQASCEALGSIHYSYNVTFQRTY